MTRSVFAPNRLLGRLARWPLRLISRQTALPVISGPNLGARWVVGAGHHSCWLGTYERDKLAMVCNAAKPGMVVFDVGAHAGYYTIALARRVGPSGRVVAFEADAKNVENLRRHIAINKIVNVTVIAAAVSDRSGVVRFRRDAHGYQGSIAAEGETVRSVRLDEFGRADLVKMDIEGAEGPALAGAAHLLKEPKLQIFLSMHGVSDDQALHSLAQAGFGVRWYGEGELYAVKAS